ncbi:glutathione S-transferase family protein [Caulobacter sp. KR2-114]|uniref:glutathione S-transferase family protein n=1 Tax=Caulobacter sp. KR2-114 TaxID=3400912 RepID=UPI003C0F97DE
MKFYNSVGPNPHVVKMFMAEKGLEIPREEINLMAGENRQPPYVAKNPTGQMPALELDDGVVLSEITAICEYLDEKHPNPPLIGATPEERAVTRMWARRIDLNILEPMANGFRYSQGLALFQNRMRCIPQAADDLKAIAAEKLAWLDGQMAGKTWIVGDRFTLADILLYCFLQFGAQVGQPLDPANKNIAAWLERVKARPSAAAA